MFILFINFIDGVRQLFAIWFPFGVNVATLSQNVMPSTVRHWSTLAGSLHQ